MDLWSIWHVRLRMQDRTARKYNPLTTLCFQGRCKQKRLYCSVLVKLCRAAVGLSVCVLQTLAEQGSVTLFLCNTIYHEGQTQTKNAVTKLHYGRVRREKSVSRVPAWESFKFFNSQNSNSQKLFWSEDQTLINFMTINFTLRTCNLALVLTTLSELKYPCSKDYTVRMLRRFQIQIHHFFCSVGASTLLEIAR